jgi:hypothetical protein
MNTVDLGVSGLEYVDPFDADGRIAMCSSMVPTPARR